MRASSGLKLTRRPLISPHLTRLSTKRRMWTSQLRMSYVNSGVRLRLNSRNLPLKTMWCLAFKSQNNSSKVIRKLRARGQESNNSTCSACQSSPQTITNHASLMKAKMKIMTMRWPRREVNRVVTIQLVKCHLKIAATPASWLSMMEMEPLLTSTKISLAIMSWCRQMIWNLWPRPAPLPTIMQLWRHQCH